MSLVRRLEVWLDTPMPILRVECLRIATPLAILGFMSSRIHYADEWLGEAGFRVPDLGVSDYRQPLYLPSLPNWAAWGVALALTGSALSVAVGFKPKKAALILAGATAFVALSDRLAAFSVSKMSPMVALTIALSPCGQRLSLDRWLRLRKREKRVKAPTEVAAGSIRFLQILLPTIYSASGISKLRGDWLKQNDVLWTHLHDTYQTWFTHFLASNLPAFAWTFFQGITLFFEVLAPLWLGMKKTRTFGLVLGVGMHTMIGLMFGPVKWFAMLMASMLIAAFLPDRYMERAEKKLTAMFRGQL